MEVNSRSPAALDCPLYKDLWLCRKRTCSDIFIPFNCAVGASLLAMRADAVFLKLRGPFGRIAASQLSSDKKYFIDFAWRKTRTRCGRELARDGFYRGGTVGFEHVHYRVRWTSWFRPLRPGHFPFGESNQSLN
ncbi:hypothetical protein TRP66_18890 [Pseudomonas sp. JDS28PS106]|uniref:hypothetical protein n=1 Tax=Pseudomonas sp. JDS28PS106 TaxID=2497235 RepID=UPI002FD2A6DD